MKRAALRFTLLALVATTAFAACLREDDRMGMDVPTVTLRVTIPEAPFTKAGFTVPDEGTGLHLKWMSGDQLRVINHSNPNQNAVYDIQDGFTDHTAVFAGPAVAGDHYDILAPGSFATVEEALAGNPDLTQDGNGKTDHLVFTALLENVPKDLVDAGDIAFTPAWAQEKGVTLKRGGIVKFVLTLPDAVTAPTKVTLTGLGPDVSVKITNVDLSSEHVLTAYAQSGWDDVALVSGTEFTVSVLNQDGTCYAATKTLPANVTLKGGVQNSIQVADGFTEQLFAGGNGTPESPWLIANAKQLGNIYGALEEWQKKYFLLIEDIDMADWLQTNTWKPINNVSPYTKPIFLDGGGHSIDHFTINKTDNTNNHCGFFGVLFGEVCNLTFTNAQINNSYNVGTGILASFCGYTKSKQTAHVYNVHLHGNVFFTGDGNEPVGGLAGRLDNAVVESTSADVHIWSNKNDVGGLFGIDIGATPSTASIIRNCWTSGTVRGRQRVGGMVGNIGGASKDDNKFVKGTQIINCFSTAELDKTKWNESDKTVAQGGDRSVGGIVGFAVLGHTGGNGAGARDEYPDNRFHGCIAWQSHVGQTATGDSYPAGAIVGYTSIHNYLENCWRNPQMVLSSLANNITLEDQVDASPKVDLVVTNPDPSAYHYLYPYHGKAASSGKTLSQVASEAGWSTIAWDLTGPVPVLTGNLDPTEAPSSGAGSLPIPGGHSTTPKYPTEGGSWVKVQEIAPGITYYHYDNEEDATYTSGEVAKFTYEGGSKKGQSLTYFNGTTNNKTHQNVFVVDVDLNNPAYEVKMVRTSTDIPTSQMFSESGAYVVINGGYERSNIFERDNAYYYTDRQEWVDYPAGYPASLLPNDEIQTGLPNWKSQGTLYLDGHRGVRIAFDGYDPVKAASSINPPLKTAAEMRYLYRFGEDNTPGVLSSSAMLIDNFNQVGATFHSTWYPGSSSHLYDGTYPAENPYRHQRSLYPRTAVAVTSNNHLLLFVCDGRYKKEHGGTGMSSGWVAKFLHDNFNPQYALNLDGGGSTTMCVKDADDAGTNGVVNYPGENYTGKSGECDIVDHEGQRNRGCFIVVMPKK